MGTFKDIVDCVKQGGNLPIVENGRIIEETFDNGNLFIDGLIWVGTGILKGVAYLGKEAYPVFVLVGITGFFLVMCGHKNLGMKITSGSVISYTICKIISEVVK